MARDNNLKEDSNPKNQNANEKNNQTSTTTSHTISNAELQYILEGCNGDFRVDGRSCADIRPYSITGNTTQNHHSQSSLVLSNGSARVTLPGGATDIICSTKAEIGRPALLNPKEGIVDVNVDYFSSNSSSSKRQRRMEETELSQILSRLILPHALSLPSLCIVPAKYCWKISIDVLVLAGDGCVVDVASMAIYKALTNTILPVVKPIMKQDLEGNLNASGSYTRTTNNVRDDFMIESGDVAEAITPDGALDCPIILTICILQQQSQQQQVSPAVMVVDCRSEEEICALTKVSVAVDRHGMICGVLKFGAGRGALPYRILAEITDLAVITSEKVFQNILDSGNRSNEDEDVDMDMEENTKMGMVTDSDFLQGFFNFQ